MMKINNIDTIFRRLLNCIWIACAVIIALEIAFTASSAVTLIKSSSSDIMQATKYELENKLSVTQKLADALAKDLKLTDTTISLEERAKYLKPYNDAYDLFLIGITDVSGKITSSYDDIPGEIGYRDYFKEVMQTGKTIITDAFASGADATVLNYTVCVPYYDKGTTPSGVIILSIPFDGVNEIISGALRESSFMFTLLGADKKVMSEKEAGLIGEDFITMLDKSSYLSADAKQIMESVNSSNRDTYWTVDNGNLLYVSFDSVTNTPWTLLTSIDILEYSRELIIALVLKFILIISIFAAIYFVGKHYIKVKLSDTNRLVTQMENLKKILREEKLITSDTVEELISISKSGLLDSLTNLPTRLGIKKMLSFKMEQLSQKEQGTFLLIDLDDLKTINDTHGHIVGDRAIAAFGDSLRQWASEVDGIVGRFGGDEFIAFFTKNDHESTVKNLLSMLHIELEEKGEKINIHASIGGAIYPISGTNFQELYEQADKALYLSKNKGKDCYTFSEEVK